MIYPKSIATLIEQFQKFPSVGPKSAQRMAFQVLKMPLSEVEKFANAIIMAKRTSRTCEICYNISTQSPCKICSSNNRNKSVICVVAETKDLIAIEKTNEYKGLYHVLQGCHGRRRRCPWAPPGTPGAGGCRPCRSSGRS